MAKQFRVGQVGASILIHVREDSAVVDISGATVKTLRLRKPSGVVIERATTFVTDGRDGDVIYVSVAADFDEVGPWVGQVRMEFGSTQKWASDLFSFAVAENLELPA